MLNSSSKTCILVVSSDPGTISVCEKMLSDEYQLLVAETGDEGRQLFERHMMMVQMVILDTKLKDGLAQNWIAQLNKDHVLPYIILIASDIIPAWMVDAMKEGAMDIVRKNPLYESELALAVKQGFEFANITHYLLKSAEQCKNKTVQKRFSSFLKLMLERKAEGRTILPNEIELFFPSKDRHSELPLDTIIDAMQSGNLSSLVKSWKERPKLLIVDDEVAIRDSLKSVFWRDFDLVIAESCEEAAMAFKTEPSIDIAILDVGLPDMSGDDFVPFLKAKYPNVQILMLTGYKEYRLIVKTFKYGAGDYVVKPFHKESFKQRVFSLLQTSLIQRVLASYMSAEGVLLRED